MLVVSTEVANTKLRSDATKLEVFDFSSKAKVAKLSREANAASG